MKMSIPQNSVWRGCAANFRQPVNEVDERAAKSLVAAVYYFNCRSATPPLPDIVYRCSSGEEDILRHVFRWDLTPCQDVFRNGFQARRQQDTPDEIYYNLAHCVQNGVNPLDSRLPATHVFISTTLNSAWYPSHNPAGTEIEAYRYEIYSPGGIWVAQTLGDHYQYPALDEVCFVDGIAPQYIRSAQLFRLTAGTKDTRREKIENVIRVNGNYNPQSHPSRLLNIRRPIFDSLAADGSRVPVTITIYRPLAISERDKRQVSTNSDTTNWYVGNVANPESYINAAFRSSYENEAYLFMKNEYVRLKYAPGTTNDNELLGPLPIFLGYPSLKGTTFAEYGIDCAFQSHNRNEAFIFSGNLCAHINYAPHSLNDKIIKGSMTITKMFPFFKGTMFESGVDTAFENTRYEAYIFKNNQYALINYGSNSQLIAVCLLSQGFPSLKNTIFRSGIDAAFASHRTNEAYLFKGDSYTLINIAPGITNDCIIGGMKKILPNFPSLRSILPCKKSGVDIHEYKT